MNNIDTEFGAGMGSKVMKVILLLLPVFAFVLFVAHRALYSTSSSVSEEMKSVVNLSQKIFSSPSHSSAKHANTGKQH